MTVGRYPRPSRTIVLLLSAVLAGPWNLALANLEDSHQSALAQRCTSADSIGSGSAIARAKRWASIGTPSLRQDDQEQSQEGDDADPFRPWCGLSLTGAGSRPDGSAIAPASQCGGGHARPIERLCPLRC
jgi:hypothetical protein